MSTTTRPLNFAVIGCGALAQMMHIPHIAESDRMVLHTCCDLSDESLKVCREKFGALHTASDFKAVAGDPDIDVICLATTEKLRLPVIEAAAAAGKPIYVEKPMAPTLEETYAIQKVVKQAGIPFCVGHNRRNAPAMIEAHRIWRQHMDDPKPYAWRWDRDPDAPRPDLPDADVAAMSVRINDDWWSWKKWVFDKNIQREGAMLFEMTHFTDLCNWFLDAEPKEVAAIETGMLNHGVIISYETGEVATILMGANGTFGYPKELFELMGGGGFMAIDHMLEIRTAGIVGAPDHQTFDMINDRHPEVGKEGGFRGWIAKTQTACAEVAAGTGDSIFTGAPDKGHRAALERFVDEITGVGPQVIDVDEAVRATRVSFAALRAAKEKRTVALAEV